MTADWAIAAECPDDLERVIQSGHLRPAKTGWETRLADGSPIVFERLYLGDEFCQHLIVSRRELERAIGLCEERGIGLTLATPPVTDEGISRWIPLVEAVARLPGAEVVANDWGMLRRIGREFPQLPRLLGRTLRRQLKDPREQNVHAHGRLTESFQRLLNQWGVRMLEVDRLPAETLPMPCAVHLPFEFVASGRICAPSGVSFPDRKKFLVDFACPKPCRQFYLELDDPACRSSLRQKGNTLYAPNGMQKRWREAPWVARWVYDLSVDKSLSVLAPLEALV